MKKKYIWIILIVLILAAVVYRINAANRSKPKYQIAYTVGKQNIRQTVLATGTVTSKSNLNLSFKNSGILKTLNFKVGDQVKAGQVLANLDQKDVLVSIKQAEASLLSAQANYEKILNGASSEDIWVAKASVQSAEVALNNAQASYTVTIRQQQALVDNAYAAMLNSGLAAIPSSTNTSTATVTATVTITGTYSGRVQGQYKITAVEVGQNLMWELSGLENGSGFITRGFPQQFGTHGLYFNFSNTGTISRNDYWFVNIPNTQASSYLTNYNAYQAALQTQTQALTNAQSAIDTAKANLDSAKASLALKQMSARPEDLKAVLAQVANAQAGLQAAKNNFQNNIISAPIDGQITAIDVKVGENITAQKIAIVMLDHGSLRIESNVPESSIALVKPGQKIEITFDAFGPDKRFLGEALSIDPASTIVSGVINYRVLSSIPQDPGIKPGMTANLVILIDQKQEALAIPNRLIKLIDGKKFVSAGDAKNAKDVEIKAGFTGDSFTEVISGLAAGQNLVAPINNK